MSALKQDVLTNGYLAIHGFLVGIYDSRGGTLFVEADDLDEARKIVLSKYFPHDEAFDFEPDIDLICQGKLFIDKKLSDSLLNEVDLEQTKYGGKEIQVLLEWDPIPQGDCLPGEMFNRLPDGGSKVYVRLEAVKAGDKPVWLGKRTSYHPRWDDDAWSFVLLKK